MIQNPARSSQTPSSLLGLAFLASLIISEQVLGFFGNPVLILTVIMLLAFLAAASAVSIQKPLIARKVSKRKIGKKGPPAPGPDPQKIHSKPRRHDRNGVIICVRCENLGLLGMAMSKQETSNTEQRIVKYLNDWSELHGGKCSPDSLHEWSVSLPADHLPIQHPTMNELLLALHRELESLRLPGILPKQSLRFSLGASLYGIKASYHQNLSNAQAALELARRKQLPLHIADQWMPELGDRQAEGRELIGRGLAVHFQPVCHASGYGLAWYEALLRTKPDQTLNESPRALLMEAEMTGGMPQITALVINESLQFYDRIGIPVAINLSVADLVDQEIQNMIINAAYLRTPGALVLEVLEQVNLVSIHEFGGFLARAKAAGCRIALDDFGTGYANLQTLLTVAVDIVKLDGSLIARSMEDEPVNSLLCSLVTYCQQRGISVVAEHIETSEQARHFQAMGCEFLQGYFLGKPEAACYV